MNIYFLIFSPNIRIIYLNGIYMYIYVSSSKIQVVACVQ